MKVIATLHVAPAASWPRQCCAAANSIVLDWIEKIVIGASCLRFFRLMSMTFLGLLFTPTNSVPSLLTLGSTLRVACTGVEVAVGVAVEVGDAGGGIVAGGVRGGGGGGGGGGGWGGGGGGGGGAGSVGGRGGRGVA